MIVIPAMYEVGPFQKGLLYRKMWEINIFTSQTLSCDLSMASACFHGNTATFHFENNWMVKFNFCVLFFFFLHEPRWLFNLYLAFHREAHFLGGGKPHKKTQKTPTMAPLTPLFMLSSHRNLEQRQIVRPRPSLDSSRHTEVQRGLKK